LPPGGSIIKLSFSSPLKLLQDKLECLMKECFSEGLEPTTQAYFAE
jgi:hypothetical protein